MSALRFQCCQACEGGGIYSPVSQLLPERVLFELCHLQAAFAAELSYGRAAARLRKVLPATWKLSVVTTRNHTVAIGDRIEQELVREVDCPAPVAEPAKSLTVGIDGALVKAKPEEWATV